MRWNVWFFRSTLFHTSHVDLPTLRACNTWKEKYIKAYIMTKVYEWETWRVWWDVREVSEWKRSAWWRPEMYHRDTTPQRACVVFSFIRTHWESEWVKEIKRENYTSRLSEWERKSRSGSLTNFFLSYTKDTELHMYIVCCCLTNSPWSWMASISFVRQTRNCFSRIIPNRTKDRHRREYHHWEVNEFWVN